jgi:hypothetical protein
LSKVSGDNPAAAAAAAADEDAAAGGVGDMSRNDSFSSLATINIRNSEGGAGPGAAAAGDVEGSNTAVAAEVSAGGSAGDTADDAGQDDTQVTCCHASFCTFVVNPLHCSCIDTQLLNTHMPDSTCTSKLCSQCAVVACYQNITRYHPCCSSTSLTNTLLIQSLFEISNHLLQGGEVVLPSAASLSAAAGLGLNNITAQGLGLKDAPALGLGPAPPKVATHVRSASAVPAAGGAGTAGASGGGLAGVSRPGGLSAPGVVSPRRLEGLVDPGAIAALQVGDGRFHVGVEDSGWAGRVVMVLYSAPTSKHNLCSTPCC